MCSSDLLQSDESIYERECGNMPGFAVYYRYPNSQRVTYGQFVRVSFSWEHITKPLKPCEFYFKLDFTCGPMKCLEYTNLVTN